MYRTVPELLKNDANKVVKGIATVDLSDSCCGNNAYNKVVIGALNNFSSNIHGEVLYAAWGSDGCMYVTFDSKSFLEIFASNSQAMNCGGTSAMCLLDTIRHVPGFDGIPVVVVTDGQVRLSSSVVRAFSGLHFGKVHIICVELAKQSVNRSIPYLFVNAELSIDNVPAWKGESEFVPLLRGYDARKKEGLFTEFSSSLSRLTVAAGMECEDAIQEACSKIDEKFCNVAMSVYSDESAFHRLREVIKLAIREVERHERRRAFGNKADGVSGRPHRALDLTELKKFSARNRVSGLDRRLVEYLNTLLSRLGTCVTSLSLNPTVFKAPSLAEQGKALDKKKLSGMDPQDFADFASDTVHREDDFPDEALILPFLRDSSGVTASDASVRNPLAQSCVNAVHACLAPPVPFVIYSKWVEDMNKSHPTTRQPLVGGVPLVPRMTPDAVRIVRAQLAHAFLGGKMKGPWSLWLAAVYLAARGLGFMRSDSEKEEGGEGNSRALSMLRDMTIQALELDACPVTGTPLVPFPPHHSSVAQALQFWLASPFLGYEDKSDRLREMCMVPGLVDHVLLLLDEMGEDAWDPEFRGLDNGALKARIALYSSFTKLFRIMTRGGKSALIPLVRTAVQNYREVENEKELVFLSGPGNLQLLRSKGVECDADTVLALCALLLDQSRGGASPGAIWTDLHPEVLTKYRKEADGHPFARTVHGRGVTDAWKVWATLCPATCRMPLPVPDPNAPVRFTDGNACVMYGDDYVPAHEIYRKVCQSCGRYPEPRDLLVPAARRRCTQTGDEYAVLPAEAEDILAQAVREMKAMIEGCAELRGNPSEFCRRSDASRDPKRRAEMQTR